MSGENLSIDEAKIASLIKELFSEILPMQKMSEEPIQIRRDLRDGEKIIDEKIEEKFPIVLSFKLLSMVFKNMLVKAINDNSLGVRDYKYISRIAEEFSTLFGLIFELAHGNEESEFDIREINGFVALIQKNDEPKNPFEILKMKLFR
jgi:hypothetical protein